ncbi:hypothetical protein ACJW30_03G116400 [Castanea mollissima]
MLDQSLKASPLSSGHLLPKSKLERTILTINKLQKLGTFYSKSSPQQQISLTTLAFEHQNDQKFAAQIRPTFCVINLSSPPNFLPDLPGILLKQHEVIVFNPRVFNSNLVGQKREIT